MAQGLLHLQPNKFFLSRNTAPHVGDRIEFATHPNRSLPIQEAIELAAALAVLIDDDKALGKEIAKLRGDSPKPKAPAEVPATEPAPAEVPATEPATVE